MRAVAIASIGTLASAFLLMACNIGNAQDQAPPAAGQPVEQGPPEAPGQQPAFPGQTRAPAVSSDVQLESRTIASGLAHPWALAQLPDGRWLVTERPGRLRVVGADGALSAPVRGLPEIMARGQGGLLDIALSPDFESDRTLYWSYAEPREGGNGTAVARGRLSEDLSRVEDVQVIFRALPSYSNAMHYGSRLVFDREGRLYVTLGERSDMATRSQAQDLDSHFGKIVRINADGSVPTDNPFVNREGARPEVWSLGHRNVQGAALHPETGELWAIEHGARGGDEVNVVRAGRNYGWPVIAYGIEYRGGAIGEGRTAAEGLEQPAYYFDPVIAPGGAAFYTGDLAPAWRGDLFISGLRTRALVRLVLEGERVVGEERLDVSGGQRVRDVQVGRDGALYIVTDEDDGRLIRVAPAGR
ncbi:PQQ-dependent sugar dehydrogenase [Brevundimonas sp. 2R-24]|uniref:PQQ-dependent sugar dehydrogenase n=1 Tax=Peiella sedimenti TaxID=3061083 RepID=A0ABT8SM00_9CAUL|nr:PQQ-dependent sugar dehydrogenase [Caulobacteraceae bacterium XZ-24]